jgi:hypothetical protein
VSLCPGGAPFAQRGGNHPRRPAETGLLATFQLAIRRVNRHDELAKLRFAGYTEGVTVECGKQFESA